MYNSRPYLFWGKWAFVLILKYKKKKKKKKNLAQCPYFETIKYCVPVVETRF